MKNLMILIFSFTLNHALAIEIVHCLEDAKKHLNTIKHVDTPEVCADLIKNHPHKVMAKGGDYTVYGLNHMLYVERSDPVLKKTLHAGDQTELKRIKTMRVFHRANRLLLLSEEKDGNSLLTIDIEYPGNVAPTRFLKSKKLHDATGFDLLSAESEIAVFSKSSRSVWFFNEDADMRYQEAEKHKPVLIREIKGAESQILDPVDAAVDFARKEVYILDSGRILIFPLETSQSKIISRPKEVVTHPGLSEATAVEVQDGTLQISYPGETKISLKELRLQAQNQAPR